MSTQRTCHVTNSITFSQALAVGLTHYDWLHKTEYEIAGQEAVHASHSVLPESVEAQRTRDTFGPLFGGSSPSADLARSSGSRLRALTVLNGSPEYELTWSVWAMPYGEPIIRLRALGHRTGGSGCSGWPTPISQDAKHSGTAPSGPGQAMKLSYLVQTSGWNTPQATDGTHGGPNQSGGALPADAALAGWATPAARDYRHPNAKSYQERSGTTKGEQLNNQVVHFGPIPSGSPAATEKRGVLNPALSAWLMGYPEEIISCVDWGTR